MKPKVFSIVAVFVISILSLSVVKTYAQRHIQSTGIGIRGTHWRLSNYPTYIRVSDFGEESEVHLGGGGAWLYFFSRMNENVFLEFSLGAVGKVEEQSTNYINEDVDVFAATPILLGLRYELFTPQNPSDLRPYIAFGGGPYWFTNISVKDRLTDEEVTIDTKLRKGGYAGGGINFHLARWFALNFDLKYHFVDFNVNHEYSGFEYGLGICFLWGSFKQ